MGNKLNPVALGLSLGLLWGFGLMIVNILAVTTGYGYEMAEFFTRMYPGYSISILKGSLIALLYGFLDAFIGGYILAWLYNKFNKQRKGYQ